MAADKRDRWWRVTSRRWTFGLRSRNGIVVEAAPISKWGVGQKVDTVLDWWRRKGGMVHELGTSRHARRGG